MINLDSLDALPNGQGSKAIVKWSANETRAQQPEEDDEKIVGWGREILQGDAEDTKRYQKGIDEGREITRSTASLDRAIDKVHADAKAKGTKYSKLFDSMATVRLLTRMLRLPTHFRSSKYVKLNILTGMIGTFCGVSCIIHIFELFDRCRTHNLRCWKLLFHKAPAR